MASSQPASRIDLAGTLCQKSLNLFFLSIVQKSIWEIFITPFQLYAGVNKPDSTCHFLRSPLLLLFPCPLISCQRMKKKLERLKKYCSRSTARTRCRAPVHSGNIGCPLSHPAPYPSSRSKLLQVKARYCGLLQAIFQKKIVLSRSRIVAVREVLQKPFKRCFKTIFFYFAGGTPYGPLVPVREWWPRCDTASRG